MTIQEKLKQFINKWNNKFLEVVDPTNRNQCFDLVVGWCDEIGLPRVFPHLYAYQIFTVDTDDKKKYFDKIENTADAFPQAGDIVVWSKSYNGTAGHTAISTGNHQTQGKSTDWFEAFSQNDPLGSPCILKTYKYNYVLGWLRPKPQYLKLDNYYKGIDLNNLESVKVCVDTWYEVAVLNLYVKKDIYQKEIENLQNQIKEKEATISNLNQQINDLNAKNTSINDERNRLANDLSNCQKTLKEKEEQYNNLIQEVDILRQEKIEYGKMKANWELREIDYQKRVKYLETRLQGFKSPMKTLLVDIWQKVVKGV